MTGAEFLGARYPLIQAPMAGVQDRQLTAAVSSAGALGSLPCALLSPEELRSELAVLSAECDGPFNVNFFCHQTPGYDADAESRWRELLRPYFDEYGISDEDVPIGGGRQPFSHDAADILEDFRPPVISFHFGLPSRDLLARVKGWGATVLASATTIKEALWLECHGADAVIAQGLDAGGHRGMFLSRDLTTQAGTFALVPRIVGAVDIPVIAAGGVGNAAAVAAAFSLGARAVQVGTAYLLCRETLTSPLHRAALKSNRARHTAVTNLFSGRPARSIVNRVIREIGPLNDKAPSFPLAAAAMGVLRQRAEARKCDDFSPLWCGQNATGCKEIPAAELTRELTSLL
jgi:nitronate monooxygenase